MIRNVTQWMLAAALLTGVTTLPAFAQEAENQSTTKIEDLKPKNQNPSGEDIDETITNNKLRAETGSKSKWSIGTSLDYSGGSIEKPLAEDRPNIAGAAGVTQKASLSGSIGIKRNLTAAQSLSLGVGVRWIAPLTSSTPTNYKGDRADASNPSLSYQYLYKFAGIQSAFVMGPTLVTNSDWRKVGYMASFGANQVMIYEVGHSGLSLGLVVAGSYTGFDKDGEDLRPQQSDYSVGLIPFMEYQINDKINLRTVFNTWNYDHYRTRAKLSEMTTFTHNAWTQSIGVGFAVTRDVFLYPNLQFTPENIRSDVTNVALSTNINIF